MAGHVYVSYDGQDVGYVRRLVDHLAGSWLTVWVDQEAEVAEQWSPDLEAPIRAASVMVVVMSPASQHSDRVRGEIMYAHRIGRPIIPLLLAGRPFFSQGGTPPENVIGGLMPDDEVIDRLGALSQTPITHRKSGKPGRGSASRERDSTAMLSPLRSSGYGQPVPASSSVSSYPVSSRPVSSYPVSSRPVSSYTAPSYAPPSYEDDPYAADDERPRHFRPAVLATVAGVVVLLMGVATAVVFAMSGPDKQQTTTVGASNPRTTSAAPTSGPPAGPGLTPSASAPAPTSSSKKPTTTTSHTGPPTTTTTTTATTQPPPLPGFSVSPGSASISINTTTTVTVTLDSGYSSDLTVSLSVSGAIVGATGPVVIAANGTSATFTVTAGAAAGTGTVTATISGTSHSANIDVTDP
jgi:hypothetical protein